MKINSQEVRLQILLENYFHGLRERIPSVLETNGALPTHFWDQEEIQLRLVLQQESALALPADWPQHILNIVAVRVGMLLALEADQEISPAMLRYELRIGPLSDSRAERLALRQFEGKITVETALKPTTGNLLSEPTFV